MGAHRLSTEPSQVFEHAALSAVHPEQRVLLSHPGGYAPCPDGAPWSVPSCVPVTPVLVLG
eukprot:807599-Prymnesium_polylepis.1